MANELDAVMDKIARLKQLSERPGTPDEAAAAVSAIQRLMRRHNLTQMQVNSAKRNTEVGFDKFEADLGAVQMWRQGLMGAICKYGYCTFLMNAGGRSGYIVGEAHNVVVAKELYEYLVGEINRLATDGWRRYRYKATTNKRVWCHAFRVGAADAVVLRIKTDFMAEKKAAVASSNSLVVVYENDLARAVQNFFPHVTSTRRRMSVSSSAGYANGAEAGRQINLAKQIGE